MWRTHTHAHTRVLLKVHPWCRESGPSLGLVRFSHPPPIGHELWVSVTLSAITREFVATPDRSEFTPLTHPCCFVAFMCVQYFIIISIKLYGRTSSWSTDMPEPGKTFANVLGCWQHHPNAKQGPEPGAGTNPNLCSQCLLPEALPLFPFWLFYVDWCIGGPVGRVSDAATDSIWILLTIASLPPIYFTFRLENPLIIMSEHACRLSCCQIRYNQNNLVVSLKLCQGPFSGAQQWWGFNQQFGFIPLLLSYHGSSISLIISHG